MSFIAFILIFGLVVVAHELGHFLIAKARGIRVREFAIGMGPKLIGVKRGHTNYVLRLLPLGGACVFDGEDGKYEEDKEAQKEAAALFDSDYLSKTKSFPESSVWTRLVSIAAGPIFNIILAFLLSIIIVTAAGSDRPMVTSVMEDYPAAEAGIQKGDLFTHINGERVYLFREVSLISSLNKGEPIRVDFLRDGVKHSVTITPKYDEKEGRYFMGFVAYDAVEAKGINALKYAALEVRFWLKMTYKSLGMLITGKVSGDEIAGPVGVGILIDDTIEQTKDAGIPAVLLSLLNIAILLSVNLGVLNLLPIPALDGGRLIFIILELLRGKPVPSDKEGIVHMIGFAALMVLMVVVLFNDLSRLFS